MDELAESIFEQAQDNMTWQKPTEIYKAASVLLAAQLQNQPKSPVEIAEEHDIPESDVYYAKRRISKALDMNPISTDPDPYIERYCEELGLPVTLSTTAMSLAAAAETATVGKAPTSVAAASVYLASLESSDSIVRQKDISEVANVSEVTIRTLYPVIADAAGLTLT